MIPDSHPVSQTMETFIDSFGFGIIQFGRRTKFFRDKGKPPILMKKIRPASTPG